MDLRKHTITPAAHLKEGQDPERDRSIILGTPTSEKAKANVPTVPVQAPSPAVPPTTGQLAPAPPAPIVLVPVQSSSSRGGVGNEPLAFQATRVVSAQGFPPQRWLGLTDAMKYLVVHTAAIKLGAESVPLALIYLGLSNAEIDDFTELHLDEKEQEAQWEVDVLEYTKCGPDIASSSNLAAKDYTPQQRQQLDDIEKVQRNNLDNSAPNGYLIQPEDIVAAERFVRERAKDNLTRQTIIDSLRLQRNRDYSREIMDIWESGEKDSE